MIVPDTSAWIEYLRATGSPADVALTRLIDDHVELAVTEQIVMEVLAGGRPHQEVGRLESLMHTYEILSLEGLADFEEAAALYRICRTSGETIRNLGDCLVAVPVIRVGAQLLHNDRDFDAIARHCDLRIYPVEQGGI